MNRRLLTALIPAVTLLMVLGTAAPAAAVTPEQRLSVLSSWTQTSASSYNAWNSARQNQSGWAEYAFNWSTDLCSSSPDNPLGFNFQLSCYRHDFGYRNYHAVGQFSANKSRLDDAFYADLQRKCATYSSIVRPACYSLAWVYYQAVRQFGDIIITPEQVAQAAELLPAGRATSAGG
jgi:phospholipase A2-like protein